MKPNPFRRLTALILALAMTFCLACTAAAAELDEVPAPAVEVVAEEPALPVTEEEPAEEPAPEAPAEEETPVEEEPAEEAPEEEEPAEEAPVEEEPAEEAPEAPEEETPVEEEPVEEITEPAPVVPEADECGWTASYNKEGELRFSFYCRADGVPFALTDGYYSLPEARVTVPAQEEGGEATVYRFDAGIYAFSPKGFLKKEIEEETASISYSTVTLRKDGQSYRLGDAAKRVVSLSSVTEKVTKSGAIKVTPHIDIFSGKFSSRYYFEGKRYTGLMRLTETGKLYIVDKGVKAPFTGVMNNKAAETYICNYQLVEERDRLLYDEGRPFNGVYTNRYFYENGAKQLDKSGWDEIDDNTYYFKSGRAVKGEQRLKRNGHTYQYTFLSDGTLVTNLFKYDSSYRKKKLLAILSRQTHTATILAYNNETDSYDIPVKSFVVSMSKSSSNTRPGTYRMTQRNRWWKFRAGLWYQYATYVSGSGSWTHSEQYSSPNLHALKTNSYNGLGTNQSKQCIRMQVVNCKLMYDLSRENSSLRVKISKTDTTLPFGKMTLSHNYDYEGKISKNYDPTDPLV